ncbi:MAG TPA: hypothetical protein VF909_06645 [Roseiflexaceae bacterium]
MTERQGAFTVSTRLLLSAARRARLERLVRSQRIDLADLVSMIVADHCDALPSAIVARPAGAVTIPIRLYLTAEARQQIEAFTHARAIDLADLVSQIVAGYLDTLPDTPPDSAPEPARDSVEQLRQRRAELGRLRARRDASGAQAPAWLASYIAELEAELKRLEA